MRDFLPLEKLKREQVLARIRGTYRSHGFSEIETPALEVFYIGRCKMRHAALPQCQRKPCIKNPAAGKVPASS